MKKFILFCTLICIITVSAQENKDIEYIRKHALLAVQEQKLYNIPASITLSQGLIETGGGQSRLAEQAYNHFGIKCKDEWTGGKIYHDDDAKGECFRVYNNVEESYRDHSKFLAERPYYKSLFLIDIKDYKAWAHGLKKAGYATNPKYPSMLISRIEKYNLDQFDQINDEQVYAKLVDLYGQFDGGNTYLAKNSTQNNQQDIDDATSVILASNENSHQQKNQKAKVVEERELNLKEKNIIFNSQPELPSIRLKNHPNKIQYVLVKDGETIGSIAKLYNAIPSKLAEFNEISLGSKLKEGQIIFFGKKKQKGNQETYRVKEGDDMYAISQRFGIKISNLYKLNRMDPGSQPRIGQTIHLKKKVKA